MFHKISVLMMASNVKNNIFTFKSFTRDFCSVYSQNDIILLSLEYICHGRKSNLVEFQILQLEFLPAESPKSNWKFYQDKLGRKSNWSFYW